MRLAVIGSGYVGLVAGAGFADFGNTVICVDVDAQRVARLRAGEIPIYEPGLEQLVARNVADGRLTFTTDTATAVAGADVVFIAVGTPTSADGRSADLTAVLTAAASIGRGLTGYAVVATKSTVPVGTGDKVRTAVAEHTDQPFSVASNPEFLKEGDAVNDFMKPARVIFGVDDDRALSVLRDLYEPFVRTRDRIHIMDVRSAELTKYTANALLASRISFMNEIAQLAERVGADVEAVRLGVGADPRIGPRFLFPGPGFGGSCFPKDLRALVQTGHDAGLELEVSAAVVRANERQKKLLGERIAAHFGDLSGKRIAVLGVSFKPGTDDIRESPALVLIDELTAAGAEVAIYDPAALDNARALLGDRVDYATDVYAAATGADALVIVTEWRQFRRPDFRRLRELMRGDALFDGRNVWSAREVNDLGFAYYAIGRPRLSASAGEPQPPVT